MKKIECIFVRKHIDNVNHTIGEQRTKYSRYLAIDEINPGCEWVFNGEGIPTIKWDGTAVLVKEQKHADTYAASLCDNVIYQRYASKECFTKDVMDEKQWLLADTRLDNGKNIYWIPATDKWILEAVENTKNLTPGTYEAIGPKINGNRYKADNHVLVKHGWGNGNFDGMLLDYSGIKEFLANFKLQVPEIYEDWVYHEGIVFHHPDGRMAKIRRADFGF